MKLTIGELRTIVRNELNEAEVNQFDLLKGMTSTQHIVMLSSVENPNEILKKSGQSGLIFLSPFTDKVFSFIKSQQFKESLKTSSNLRYLHVFKMPNNIIILKKGANDVGYTKAKNFISRAVKINKKEIIDDYVMRWDYEKKFQGGNIALYKVYRSISLSSNTNLKANMSLKGVSINGFYDPGISIIKSPNDLIGNIDKSTILITNQNCLSSLLVNTYDLKQLHTI